MGEETNITCRVCDAVNSIFRMKCSECDQYLGKAPKKGQPRSKQSKGRDKYKRKPPECNGNKTKYNSRWNAEQARKRIYGAKNASLRVYNCKLCRAFHLTKYRG